MKQTASATTTVNSKNYSKPCGRSEESDFQSCHVILYKMSKFQPKICHLPKNTQENIIYTQNKRGRREKQSIEIMPEEALMLGSLKKQNKTKKKTPKPTFKPSIINMLKVFF